MAGYKYIQTNTFYQAGSGSIIGATSVVLTSLIDIYGNVLTMTDFGDKGFITFEPDTTNEESATFTGVTANANLTYTLTGVKTALAKSPYTETSGLVRQHSGGTKVVVSDTTAFWNTFGNKANDETITGQWTFNTFPVTPSNSDASTTVKGVTKLSVAPVLSTSPIAVGDNDSRIPVAYAVDSVGTDAYAITPSPAITAYAAGQVFTFKAGTANTTAATLNVSGLGAKTIKKSVSLDLDTGDILLNQIVMVEYDGTNMQLISRSSLISSNPTIQIISSTGTYTAPTGLKYAIVEAQAGGGGGGGSQNSSGSRAGGGGGGEWSQKIFSSATIGASQSVTIGAAGTAGIATSSGGAGGNTTFGALLTANGGSGGSSGLTGGNGGTGGNGTINIPGYYGETATNNVNSGTGGNSVLGAGGIANGGGNTVGNVGVGFGAGGSGGSSGGSGQVGGAGTIGVLIVREYYS